MNDKTGGQMTDTKPSDEALKEMKRLTAKPRCDLSLTELGRLDTLASMYLRLLAIAELHRQAQSPPAD